MPPPSLVFYAARNILYPSFILGQIPDLLNLLSAIDVYRRFSCLKADEALVWQKYYSNAQNEGLHREVRMLKDKEVKRLEVFVAKREAQRTEYVLLLQSLIKLYVHYLWTAPESCLLGKRLNDFFPGSIEGLDKPSNLLFHDDLSEGEADSFMQVKDECQKWMHSVVDWEGTRETRGEEEGLSKEEMDASYAEEFREVFPHPFNPLELAKYVEIYIKNVEGIVQKLADWFGPPPNVSPGA
ncbi:hypothetical protein BU15DRAFT_50227 [Melanogaster broomeanus]|nr:hypothetical protein BU15DRAFT_50227 [Melanogaster broomeanus]